MEFISDINKKGEDHYFLKFKDNEYYRSAENGTDVEVSPTTATAQRVDLNNVYLRDHKIGDTKEEILKGLNDWLQNSLEGKYLRQMYNAGHIRDHTVRDQDVLLLFKKDNYDPDMGSFEIVTGQNEDGTPKTIVPVLMIHAKAKA
jgi:hypothetical protein